MRKPALSSWLDTSQARTQEANAIVKDGAGALVAKVVAVVAMDVEATRPSMQILSSRRPHPSKLIWPSSQKAVVVD